MKKPEMHVMTPAEPATVPAKCRVCAGPLESPVLCSSCGELNLNERVNHFELLGLEPQFDLDPRELRTRFLNLSRRVHPDRFVGAAAPTQETALAVSAQANAAYEILRDPLRRAEYLLELCGGPSAAIERTVPPAVLMQSMELREELEAAGTDPGRVHRVHQELNHLQQDCHERILSLARRLPGDAALQRELRLALNSIRYYQRPREQAAP